MGHLGSRRGLRVKAADELRVAGQVSGQNFDGHVAIERFVVGHVHVAHAAAADPPEDPVVTKPLEGEPLRGRRRGTGPAG